MECGAGFTYDADTNLTGPEAVRYTMQAAASNGLTLVRSFGHGHDAFKSIILQPRAGGKLSSLHSYCCRQHAALCVVPSLVLPCYCARPVLQSSLVAGRLQCELGKSVAVKRVL